MDSDSRCRICGGKGYVGCLKCHGSGKLGQDKICPVCSGPFDTFQGQGVVECRSCKGSFFRSSTGNIELFIEGDDSNEVKNVMSALLDKINMRDMNDYEGIHPNIKVLLKRMDLGMAIEDYYSVLHSSASIFETLAKDIINSPNVENQTLASFFESYRKESKLPNELVD